MFIDDIYGIAVWIDCLARASSIELTTFTECISAQSFTFCVCVCERKKWISSKREWQEETSGEASERGARLLHHRDIYYSMYQLNSLCHITYVDQTNQFICCCCESSESVPTSQSLHIFNWSFCVKLHRHARHNYSLALRIYNRYCRIGGIPVSSSSGRVGTIRVWCKLTESATKAIPAKEKRFIGDSWRTRRTKQ